ncbi:putative esophageal gland cell secretory protein 12 [Aphelenchoides fujianensis]|nr:putative esophageal gland cell secretory protein 12 [Aphelenchoides fujianensis]
MLGSAGPRSIFLAAVLLALGAGVGMACKCRFQKPWVTYCLTDWTAHAVVQNVTGERDDSRLHGVRLAGRRVQGEVPEGLQGSRPEEVNGTLPTEVYTPEEEAACGLALEAGGEYLLSGRIENGSLISMLCGQILFDDFKSSRHNDVLLWREVPKKTIAELKTRAYEPKCKQLYD